MNRLLLHRLDLQCFHFLIEDLTLEWDQISIGAGKEAKSLTKSMTTL
jgi:hypothetical protein